MLTRRGGSDVTIYAIVGIIGVGKSTLLQRIKDDATLHTRVSGQLGRKVKVAFMFEDVDAWMKLLPDGGQAWLPWFYEKPRKRAFEFQLMICNHYIEQVNKVIEEEDPDIIVAERSMLCQRLFWACQPGTTTRQEMQFEKLWALFNSMIPPLGVAFHLKTTAAQAMRRVGNRERQGEVRSSQSDDAVESSDDTTEGTEFLMDSLVSTSGTTTDDDASAKMVDGGGVTVKYQKMLLSKHNEMFTPGLSRPSGFSHDIETVELDASLPYHQDELAYGVIISDIANAIVGNLRRREYKPLK